jgi:hypothetical protein
LLRVFSLKPRTVMSSIIRARSALTGRGEGVEVIGGFLSRELDLSFGQAEASGVGRRSGRPRRLNRRAGEHEERQVLGRWRSERPASVVAASRVKRVGAVSFPVVDRWPAASAQAIRRSAGSS